MKVWRPYYTFKRLQLYFMILRHLRKTYKRFAYLILKVKKSEYPFRAILRNGTETDIYSFSQLLAFTYGIVSKYDGQTDILMLKVQGKILQFFGTTNNGEIWRTFGKNDYKLLKVEDEIVLDIGANIGDASIFFAIHGARQVISLEPYPHTYSLLQRNVLINENVTDKKIIAINAGVGEVGTTITLDPNKISGVGDTIHSERDGVEVSIFTLEHLVT